MSTPHRPETPARRRHPLRLEALEDRRAPAVLVNTTTLTYTDRDGDLVTVRTSRGEFVNGVDDFTFAPAGVGEQLQVINLSNDGDLFVGAALSVTAVRGPGGGDGFANVGYINASGIDLGAVRVDGDLGRIDAGDVSPATGVTSLTVQSLGRFGTTTQPAGGTLTSNLVGRLGSLQVRSDVVHASVLVTGGPDGRIGRVFVGGSVLGGPAASTGLIHCTGNLGPTTILGNLIGGTGGSSGGIGTDMDAARIRVGGTIAGSTGNSSGIITATHNLGPVVIGGDLLGGTGDPSGTVFAGDNLAGVRVGGSVRGGVGSLSGTIVASDKLGPVTIGGDVAGGSGAGSGVVSGDRVAAVSVGGSVRGGPGPGLATGVIVGTSALGPVSVGGDVAGGDAPNSGRVTTGGPLTRVFVGGSLLGGDGDNSGQLSSGGATGPVTVHGNIYRGAGTAAGAVQTTGRLARVTVDGSVLAGLIRSDNDIGSILIRGSLLGATTVFTATIIARGRELPAGGPDVAIGSLTVGGRVEFARILAGYDFNGLPANPDAQVGPVVVGGDWVASNLVAGVVAGGDAQFGTADDAVIGGVVDGPRSRIASITIKGQALGTTAAGDHFGLVAEEVGALSIGGTAIPLLPNTPGVTDDEEIGATGDFHLLEV